MVLGFLLNEMRQLCVVWALHLACSGLNHYSPPMSHATLGKLLLTLGMLLCYFPASEPGFLHL